MVHRLMADAEAASDALRNATCNTFLPRFMQLLAYSACLHDYGAQHRWMGAPSRVGRRTVHAVAGSRH